MLAAEEDIWQPSVMLLSNKQIDIDLAYVVTATYSSIDTDLTYKNQIVVYVR
jgi:hypothetical protein